MAHRITVALDDEAFDFLEMRSKKNRSAFINRLLKDARAQQEEEDLIAAYQQLNSPEMLAEFADWDVTLADGLEGE